MAYKTLSLSIQEKKEVFDLLERWKNSPKLYSKRDPRNPLPDTVLNPVINVSQLAFEKYDDESQQKEVARRFLKELVKTNLDGLNKGAKIDLAYFVDQLMNDKQVWRLSYAQYLFFLYWLRRFL